MSKKDRNNVCAKKKRLLPEWVIVGGVILLLFLGAAAIWWFAIGGSDWLDAQTEPTQITDAPTEGEDNTEPTDDTSEDDDGYTDIGDGLSISKVYKYAGVFMEDGSDDTVSDVMMVTLRNDSEKDLQLARISFAYPKFTAEFEATNLPAGESVVLLEKNRRKYTEEYYQGIVTENVAFFPEPMSLMEDQVQISGDKGHLEVKNISDNTLGMMYIYYKNSASDIFYGGITYRTKIEAGMKPGETVQVAAGHYNSETCKILHVQIADEVTE